MTEHFLKIDLVTEFLRDSLGLMFCSAQFADDYYDVQLWLILNC